MEKVLIISGPTATGKTKLAISLAKKFNGELINADSRQMYQGFDILSGKDIPQGQTPNKKKNVEIRGKMLSLVTYTIGDIPVWLYDVVPPEEEVSIAVFRDLADICIHDITARGKLPIVVGGTGYYLSSLQESIDSLDIPPDKHLRNSLIAAPLDFLQKKLQSVDQKRWDGMNHSDKNNPRRLIRAIEVAEWKRTHAVTMPKSSDRDLLWIGLSPSESGFENIIHARVMERMKVGAVEEARSMEDRNLSSHVETIIGFPVLKELTGGKISEEEAISRWTRKEVQYAKRQMTWFRKQSSIHWFPSQSESITGKVEQEVATWYTT